MDIWPDVEEFGVFKRNDRIGVEAITINICGDNVGIFTTCSVVIKTVPSQSPMLRAPKGRQRLQ